MLCGSLVQLVVSGEIFEIAGVICMLYWCQVLRATNSIVNL